MMTLFGDPAIWLPIVFAGLMGLSIPSTLCLTVSTLVSACWFHKWTTRTRTR